MYMVNIMTLKTKATNFKFDEKTTDLIERLMIKNSVRTKAEVIRKAIALLDVISDAKESGHKILIVNQDGTSQRELILY